jgi:phosphoribosylformylglycinamidine synthase
VTDTGRMELVWNGETVADIPLDPLADEAPLYERPYAIPTPPEPLTQLPDTSDVAADLLKLIGSPALASRRWVWEQYDQTVGADTVQRPGGDAAVVRVHGSKKALAITTDCTPRYCFADPYEGGKQAVAEAYRNLCAVGAKPLAITNCLNFGNPQRPEIMGQLVACIEGIAEACRALDFPIVSGNVSLYNESKATGGGSAILPTPAIGGVGLLDDWEKSATIGFKVAGHDIILIGPHTNRNANGELGQSLWLREVLGRSEGPPPSVDLDEERRSSDLIRHLISQGLVSSVHDVSDGGILVAVAEMALAGNLGAELGNLCTDPQRQHHFWFGENQARFVIAAPRNEGDVRDNPLWTAIADAGAGAVTMGTVISPEELVLSWHGPPAPVNVSLADLRAAHEGFFPKLMGSELTPDV